MKRHLITGIFACAMGFLEAIVVVYLRELYYPQGFSFPLSVLDEKIYLIELIREAATLIMLWMIGMMNGKSLWERFSWFLYGFGIWDIFYYLALKILIGWPETLFTWDLLFLIPVCWIGPVLAPLISSFLMIGIRLQSSFYEAKGTHRGFDRLSLILLFTGALLCYISYTWDYTRLLLQLPLHELKGSLFTHPGLITLVENFRPQHFGWTWHLSGSLLILASMYQYSRTFKKGFVPKARFPV